MNSITQNKQQTIHVVSEIIVLIGVIFYFNQRHKKLLKHIEEISQRLENQEELLQKHDETIKKIVESIKSQPLSSQRPQVKQPTTQVKQPTTQVKQPTTQVKQPTTKVKNVSIPKTVPITNNILHVEEEKESFVHDCDLLETVDEELEIPDENYENKVISTEEDLDAELANELGELEETINID